MSSRNIVILTSRRKRRLLRLAANSAPPGCVGDTGPTPYDVEWGEGANVTTLTSYEISNTSITVSGASTSNYVVILWADNTYAVVAVTGGAYSYTGEISVADLTAIAIDVWGKADSGHNLNNDSLTGAEVYPLPAATGTYCYP